MAPNSKFAKMSSRELVFEFNKRIIGLSIKNDFTGVNIGFKEFYLIRAQTIFSAILKQKNKDTLIGRKYRCWGAYMYAFGKPEDNLQIAAKKFIRK